MILRFLNIQGVVGIAVSLCLGLLLVLEKGETRHWRKQSGQFEQLYRGEQAAFAGTVANYRAAAEAARAADKAAAERVAAEQRAISERTIDAFHHRLADARNRGERLRREAPAAAADPRGRGSSAVPSLSAAAGGPHQAAGQDGLSAGDRLTATEQAIQLDELIKWVKAQAKVDNNADPGPSQPAH
jgi:hypothetical protein